MSNQKPKITAFFAVFDQHFFLCQEVQIFVKKSWELHIVKCISHTFQELFSEVNYLYYFLSYVVIEFYKREKTYCICGFLLVLDP